MMLNELLKPIEVTPQALNTNFQKSITHYIKLKIFTNPFNRGSEAFPVTK